MSHMTPAAPHPFLRRSSSVVERALQGRRSFREILARATSLDLGHGDASSADTIACYFLRRQQESLDAHLSEQEQLQRIGLRKLMNLLRFSSICSWKAALLCGSLYKSILDASLSVTRVQTILEAPSPHSHVGDLLLSVSHLQDLFSDQTCNEIEHGKDLFFELDREIKRYQHRLLVRALSRVGALDRRAHDGVSRYRRAMREIKSYITKGLTMCYTGITGRSNSDKEGEPLALGMSSDGDDDDDEDDFNAASDDGAVTDHSALLREWEKPASSAFTGFTPLHKEHVRLHKLETCMHAVSIMFDTLKSLVKGTHSQTLNQRYIESLRDEPLMFYGVAELISSCHASLSKHLDDLREQVLISFCFINSARDLVYSM